MAKRKNKAAGKKGGSGCGGLLVLLVLAAIFGRPSQQGSSPRSTATLRATSTIRSQAAASQPRNTVAPSRTPAEQARAISAPVTQNEARAIPVSQQTQTNSELLYGDGITLRVEEVQILPVFEGEPSRNGALILITANMRADSSKCVHGWDFKLTVGGQAYEADTGWMNKFKTEVDRRDYPGWGITGQCFSPNETEPTFLVFDVPVEGSGLLFSFFTSTVNLGEWETAGGLRAVRATSTPQPQNTSVARPTRTIQPTRTAQPTRTPTTRTEEYTATGNANVRSCPKTTCDIVRGVSLGERLTKIGEAQGDSVNGSSLWYEIRLATGATGFIHSGLARAGTPRPAPVVQQPRATTAPNQAAPTSAGDTQPEAPSVLPTIPQSTAAPSRWTCSGNQYNCSDFSNRNDLMDYWNTCPGDPSDLDGNDNDGIPCESIK